MIHRSTGFEREYEVVKDRANDVITDFDVFLDTLFSRKKLKDFERFEFYALAIELFNAMEMRRMTEILGGKY